MVAETVDVRAWKRIVVQLAAAVGQFTIRILNAFLKGANRNWGALHKMYYGRDGMLICFGGDARKGE